MREVDSVRKNQWKTWSFLLYELRNCTEVVIENIKANTQKNWKCQILRNKLALQITGNPSWKQFCLPYNNQFDINCVKRRQIGNCAKMLSSSDSFIRRDPGVSWECLIYSYLFFPIPFLSIMLWQPSVITIRRKLEKW